MKSPLSLFFFIFTLPLLFSSCSEEEEMREIENKVTYKFYTNTPGVPVTLTECVGSVGKLIIKENWEQTSITKWQYASMKATCEDPNTLLTCEIYVNGRFWGREQGNRYVRIVRVLKGNPI